jgi:Leucine-rich repeat (LRR) protein
MNKPARKLLSHNQLSELPPEIGQLSNLRTLRVGHNQLTVLTPEIRKLSKLTIYGWNE